MCGASGTIIGPTEPVGPIHLTLMQESLLGKLCFPLISLHPSFSSPSFLPIFLSLCPSISSVVSLGLSKDVVSEFGFGKHRTFLYSFFSDSLPLNYALLVYAVWE